MMAARFLQDDRIAELLTDRAVYGLDPEAQGELEKLAAQHPDYDEEALDEVAAALALNGLRVEPLPPRLRERIQSDAQSYFASAKADNVVPITTRASGPRPATAWAGWFAAAASVLLAVAAWWRGETLEAEAMRLADARSELAGETRALQSELAQIEARIEALTPPSARTLEDARAALAERPGTVSWSWTKTDDPSAAGARGDVVWNSDAQAGFMRFEGLAANDPGETQYQLWIFDARRDDRFPVDGGVFDVPAGTGEVIVPIQVKLPVGEVALFAVTVERPGGVVVSSRERIAVVAQPGA
jgi:hypothetical protein